MMRVFALALFAAVIGFGAMVPEAEAKRLGAASPRASAVTHR